MVDYERWKAAGEPDIRRWQNESREEPRSGCATFLICFVWSFIVFGIVAFIGLAGAWYLLVRPVGITSITSTTSTTAPAIDASKAGAVPTPSVPRPLLVTPSPAVDPQAAQRRAVALYPSLGVANTPLNREFIRHYIEYQRTRKEYFDDPEWPTKMAGESQAAIERR
jgi:hypothetical protein